MVTRTIYILLFFLSSFCLQAQEYIKSVHHYNLEKGLATRSIISSYQDSDGFMWFATDIGAYRFDGVEFKLFQRTNTSKGPLFTNWITEDDQNNKWFVHPDLLEGADFSILQKDAEHFISFKKYFKDRLPFPMEEMGMPILGQEKEIWLRNKNNGDIYEYKDNTFVKVFNMNSLGLNKEEIGFNHLSLNKDRAGNTWGIQGDELFKLTENGTILKKEKLPFTGLSISIAEDGKFWFTGERESIYFKENEAIPIAKFEYPKDEGAENKGFQYIKSYGCIVERLEKDYDDWYVNIIDAETKKKISFENIFDEVATVHKVPGHFYFENENTFWMSIYEGIVRVEFHESPFHKILEDASTRWIQRGENNKIWAATDNGFMELDPFNNLPPRRIIDNLVGAQNGIKDKDGNYWFGIRTNEVARFTKNDLWNFKKYKLNFDSKPTGDVYTVYQNSKDNSIWAGGKLGLYRYDEAQDSFLVYKNTNGFEDLGEAVIKDIKEANSGQTILVASSIGLFQIDLQEGVTQHHASENNAFPYDNLVFIHADKVDGTIWIGTDQGGLIHWDISSGKTERLTKADGLSDNKVYAVFEDDFGFLWLPSNNGLMRFNKKTKEVTTYHHKDGLVHDEFNFFSQYEDEDGTLYFGGIRGITSFDPKDVKIRAERPRLELTKLEVLDEKGEDLSSILETFHTTNQVELSPSRATFKLTASLLDYTEPSANQYFYKVEGLENRWILMERNSMRMNSLPAGDYKVLVKAKNSAGLWSGNQLEIPLRMLKPFYLKWWFITAMVALFVGLVRLYFERRTYVLEKDKQKLEEEVARRTEQIEKDKAVIEKQAKDLKQLDELKSRFFANVTHELRTPLTLITGPLQALMQTSKLDAKTQKILEAIAQNGEQLKRLIEEILDLNRIDAQKLKLHKEPFRLQELVQRWMTNFEPEAENRKIKFKLDYNATNNLYLNMDVQKLESIVTNLLSNAFKFSREGDVISLKVLEENDKIKMEVADTGIGIHEKDLPNVFQRFYQSQYTNRDLQGGLGIGLSLCDELAKLMKGEISVSSRLGFGSTFTLVFPKEKVDRIMSGVDEETQQKFVKIEKRKDIIGIGERKNILLVEDNVQMQKYVQDILEPIANIQIASNGKEALKLLHYKNSDIHLIVSDVMMPEMDGFTLLEILKMEERWQMTPFVMLTARTDIKDKIKALTIGVDDYIFKPFVPDELMARVQNLLTKLDLRNEPIEFDEVDADEKQKETRKEYQMENTFEEIESADVKWIKEVEQIAIENITTPNFNVSQFAFKVLLGERQLSRKLKKLTGMTPGNYLKEVRLQTARHLLESRAFSTVAEISNHVGFNTAEYFSRIFKERFGKLPKEYLQRIEKD